MLINSLNNFSSLISGGRGGIESVLDKLPMGICLYEIRDTIHIIYMNSHYLDTIGYTPEAYRDKIHDAASMFVEEDAWKLYSALNGHGEFSVDCRGKRADGELRWFQIRGVQVDFVKSVYPVFLTVINDMSEYKALEQSLLLNSERYRIFEETTPAFLFEYHITDDTMIFSHHKDGGIERRVVENYTLFNRSNSSLVHPDDVEKFTKCLMDACLKPTKATLEYRSKAVTGEYNWCRTYYVSVQNEFGNIDAVFGRIQDITEEVKKRSEMTKLIEHDTLTQTYNRDAFIKRVNKAISALGEKDNGYFAMIDIDDFKLFNDSYGHIVGDNVLITVSNYIRSAFRDGIVGRFGGDEFTIFVSGVTKEDFEGRFKKALEYTSFNISGKNVKITYSVGAACFKGRKPYDLLLEKADEAMYEAKRKGKNAVILHNI